MLENRSDRRSFLKTTVTGAAGILAASGMSASRRALGANNRIRIGLIGCGGRGNYLRSVVKELGEEGNAEIVAVCDVWKKNLNKTGDEVKANFGTDPKRFQRYRDVLALSDVDAVMIATPDFAHSRILTEAAYAKKHVFCEKPMSNNLADACTAVDAVESTGVVCQVGTQRRSSPWFQKARELVQTGVLGPITEVECCWNRNVPSWLDDPQTYADMKKEDVDWEQFLMYLPQRPFDPCRLSCWHLYRDYTIGLVGLLGSHIIDVGTWFMDDPVPESAVGLGGTLIWKEKREHYDTMESAFLFPKGFMMRFVSRLGNSAGEDSTQFRGLNGTFDTVTMTATGTGGAEGKAIPNSIPVEKLPGIHTEHVKNWLDCIRSGAQPTADVHAGYAHSVIAVMAHNAADQGRRVRYDPVKREIL